MSKFNLFVLNAEPGVKNVNGKVVFSFVEIFKAKKASFYQDGVQQQRTKDIRWFIRDLDKREFVDTTDYTGGNKAELLMGPSFSGTVKHPKKYEIFTSLDETRLNSIAIDLIGVPRISSADWWLQKERDIKDYMHIMQVVINNGYCIHNVPLLLKIFTNDELTHSIPFKGEFSTVASPIFNLSNKEPGTYVFKFFIEYDGYILHEGPPLRIELPLKYSATDFKLDLGTVPVTVFSEAYFTQQFEPCKYERIKVGYEGEKLKKIFDEKDSESKRRMPEINLLSGDGTRKVVVELEKLKTDECRHLPQYKISENDSLPHKDRAIQADELLELGMNVDYKEPKLSFDVRYPYLYLKNIQSHLFDFLLEYFLPNNTIKSRIETETCRYRHHIPVTVFPDVCWAYHVQYNTPQKGYYKNFKVTLIKGLDKEIETLRPYLMAEYQLLQFTPGGFLGKYIKEFLIDYVKSSANKFAVGFHSYYNFNEDQTTCTTLSYTNKYPWTAKTIIVAYTIVALLIDALIIYITRGRGLVTKSGKVEKAITKASNITGGIETTLRGHNITFIYPQINAHRGQGYQMLADGTIAFVMIENVTADPLFGVKYEAKHSIGSFISSMLGVDKVFDALHKAVALAGQLVKGYRWGKNARNAKKKWGETKSPAETYEELNKSNSKIPPVVGGDDIDNLLYDMEDAFENKIDALAEEFGQKFEFRLTFEGKYEANYEVRMTIGNKKNDLWLYNKDERHIQQNTGGGHVAFGRSRGIEGIAYAKVDSKFTFKTRWLTSYIPKFLDEKVPDVQVENELHGEAKIQGGISYERKYKITSGKAVYQDNVIFTGIAGEYSISNVGRKQRKKSTKENKKVESSYQVQKSFVLMDPFVEIGKEISLFSLESFKEHIL